MRKFARSIGSEGKSHGNREGQCPLAGGRIAVVVFGFGHWHSACDHFASVKATFPRWGNSSPRGTGRRLHRRRTKDCQLRTAYGGESNCIIKT